MSFLFCQKVQIECNNKSTTVIPLKKCRGKLSENTRSECNTLEALVFADNENAEWTGWEYFGCTSPVEAKC